MSDHPPILVESAVWQPGQLWEQAVAHLATRFARVRPLEDVPAPTAGPDPLAAPLAAIAAWAGDDIDVARELARYLDEHLSMHVRPDPRITRRLRAIADGAELVAVTRLPEEAAASILRHAGVYRSVTAVRTIPAGEHLPDDVVVDVDTLAPA